MTRILVQRGSAGSSSSSNQNRSATSSASASSSVSAPSPASSSGSQQHQGTGAAQVVPTVKDENMVEVQELDVLDELSDNCAVSDNKSEDISLGSLNSDRHEGDKSVEDETVQNDDDDDDVVGYGDLVKGFGGLSVVEGETDAVVGSSIQKVPGSSYPPPPPVPPPKPSSVNSTSRISPSADPNSMRMGPSRRASFLPGVSSRSSPTGSRPSSPRSHCEGEGYNSADEQNPCFSSSYDDAVSFVSASFFEPWCFIYTCCCCVLIIRTSLNYSTITFFPKRTFIASPVSSYPPSHNLCVIVFISAWLN